MMIGGFKPNLNNKKLNGYLFVSLQIVVKHTINFYKIKAVLLKSLQSMKLNFFMFIKNLKQLILKLKNQSMTKF